MRLQHISPAPNIEHMLIVMSRDEEVKTWRNWRIPGTPYQSGLLQIRYYVPRIPPQWNRKHFRGLMQRKGEGMAEGWGKDGEIEAR